MATSAHDVGDRGFAPVLIAVARAKSDSCHVEDVHTRRSGVRRGETLSFHSLAMAKCARGASRHAIAATSVAIRDIAGVTGQRLDLTGG
jgi:hypothetical protein